MKKRLWFVLIFSFIAAVSISAQTRTVTNEDLEKYRQKRVAADRDLRENYERLGFPSPADLEKQIEQSRAQRSQLAARLEAENLERAQLDLDRQRAENEAQYFDRQSPTGNYERYEDDYFNNYGLNGFYNFPNFGFSNDRYKRHNRGGFGGGYRRSYGNSPRVEYRNNLPVVIPPTRTITWGSRRRN